VTGILDGHVRLDGGSVSVTGIKPLLKDAEAVGVAAQDLKELTYRLGLPIAALARTLAPHHSGRLAAGIKPSRSKRKVMVRVGSASRLPYAGVRHWGPDATSGPRFLSVAEERLRARTFAGFGEGIKDLLDKHNW
jgi:hypothetical protein